MTEEKELMQEALKWQEHIRKLVTATDDELYHKRSKVFDWLIEQAERVQELEEENKRYKQALEEIARGRFSGASYKARQALEGKE